MVDGATWLMAKGRLRRLVASGEMSFMCCSLKLLLGNVTAIHMNTSLH